MLTNPRTRPGRLGRALILSLLALALVVVAPSAALADDDDGDDLETERWLVFGIGTVTIQPDGSSFDLSTTVYGNLIGVGTSTGTGVVTPGAGSCTDPSGQTGIPLSTSTETVITAADGDQVFVQSDSSGCFVSFEVPFVQRGTQTILGGTGRFAGASGTQNLFARSIDSDGPDVPGSDLITGTFGTITLVEDADDDEDDD